MAVYTQVADAFIEPLLAVHPALGHRVQLDPISKGSSNSVYALKTENADVILRINEKKDLADIEAEVVLLKTLEGCGLAFETPKIIVDLGGRALFPLVVKDNGVCIPFAPDFEEPIGEVKYAMLFEKLEGRELAPFEIRPAHLHQLGAQLAEVHRALERVSRDEVFRENPFGLSCLKVWNQEVLPEHPKEGEAFQNALEAVERQRTAAKRGPIHGDLFANNTKWRGDKLLSIFDWEMAGIDTLTLDLAITLNAWCWSRQDKALHCDLSKARALLSGYMSRRTLEAQERRGFLAELKLAALRFTLSRFRDFPNEPALTEPLPFGGVERARAKKKRGPIAPVRDHLDFNEYWQRYEWYCSRAAATFAEDVFWEML